MKEIANRPQTMDLLVSIGLPMNVVASLIEAFAYGKLKKAILDGDTAALMTAKGVGPKRAAQIVERGKEVFAAHKDEISADIAHYSAAMYDAEDMLDEQELALIALASAACEAQDAIEVLQDLVSYETIHAFAPLRVSGTPSYNAMPRSMLSDILAIKPGDVTDKLCLYRHRADHVGPEISAELMNECRPWQRDKIRSLIKEFRKLFVTRAVGEGFVDKLGIRYVFYTCSPGQLKKGSGYWMRKEDFDRNQHLFWGGLKPSTINKNCKKGIPMTKTLQVRALLTSAAMPSSEVFGKPILLRQMVCIGEFEKSMTAHVMSVSADYKVSEGERSDIMNNMFDGWFMMNSRIWGDFMAQCRGYGIKGLGVAFDWEGYAALKGYDDFTITDIDGVVHDLRREKEVSVIMNTSVFKMRKQYGSWKAYVDAMELLGITELYVCAINEDERENKQLSRQMTQTLFDISELEIDHLVGESIETLDKFNDLPSAIEILSDVRRPYTRRSNLAKLVTVYPDTMALPCVLRDLHDRYTSEFDSAMCGELRINGRYFFAVSDPCALADIVFGKKDPADPTIGAIKADHCVCPSFPRAKELIALRSPHAFMEWVTLANDGKHRFMPGPGIYFSVHDLTFRVLQMDFDGDHILVVDDPKLISTVKRIKREYDIPIVYYEPSVAANVGPMPLGKREFVEKIVECILVCLDTNKVGQYSNLATFAWSSFRPDMSRSEVRDLLKDIAIIAAGINHAVDAQKTYHLDKLDRAFIERFTGKPYNQRFKDANLERPHDHESWDKVTKPKGEGSVDRLGDIIGWYVDDCLMLNTSSLRFDWKLLCSRDPRHKQVCGAVVPTWIVERLGGFSPEPGSYNDNLLKRICAGDKVGFAEFFRMLEHQNAEFFKKLKENEDDPRVLQWNNKDRIELIRSIVVDFVRLGTKAVEGMEDSEVLEYAAAAILRNTFRYEKNMGRQARFVFDVFGDIYADTYLTNILSDSSSEEASADERPVDDAFDPDALCAPPEGDEFGFIFSNELDDLAS